MVRPRSTAWHNVLTFIVSELRESSRKEIRQAARNVNQRPLDSAVSVMRENRYRNADFFTQRQARSHRESKTESFDEERCRTEKFV